MVRYVTLKKIAYNILLFPIIMTLTIAVMMLAMTMTVLRGLYHAIIGMLYLAALVSVPILGLCAVNPQYSFIRPMFVVDIALCLFVFPLLIIGYDWILNKLTGGWIERSRYFKDSPINWRNR